MHKVISIVVFTVIAMFAGCHLYVDPDDGSAPCRPGDRCGGSGPNTTEPWPVPTDGGQTWCETDEQCAAGCYCEDNVCHEAGFCSRDSDCSYGYHCDEPRSSCVPDSRTASCGGTVTCAMARPACPAGQVATIANGCYTGECVAITSCDVPPSCEALTHEADCTARTGTCTAIYTGVNCHKPDGSACHTGDTDCTCDSFRFHSCEGTEP
jgi:hypothetical protein